MIIMELEEWINMIDRTIFGGNKILRHLDRIQEYKKRGMVAPLTMEVDMTNNCNNNCKGCVGGRSNRESITLEEGLSYVSQMKDYGVKALTFSGGGEPLMNPATPKVIQHASKLGMDVALITNGLLLNQEMYAEVLPYLTWTRISLDADSPTMYERTHGLTGNVYFNVLANIRGATQFKKMNQLKCTIGVGYLTGKDTLSGMVKATSTVKSLGADYLQFRPFHGDFTPIGSELEKCVGFNDDNFRVLASTQKYTHFGDKYKRPYDYCHGAHFVGVIQADSKMTLCCHTRGIEKYCIGDLKEQSFKEIWEGELKRGVLKGLDVHKCNPQFCRSDSFNRTLDDLMTEKEHENFL